MDKQLDKQLDKHLLWARSKLGSLLTPPATATPTSEEEHGEKGKDGAGGDGASGAE